jgi:hypothetical protein
MSCDHNWHEDFTIPKTLPPDNRKLTDCTIVVGYLCGSCGEKSEVEYTPTHVRFITADGNSFGYGVGLGD